VHAVGGVLEGAFGQGASAGVVELLDLLAALEGQSGQDQRHAVNVDFTYRLRRLWSLNGSLAYHSGWPGTAEELVTVTNDDGQTDYAVRPKKIYGERLPGYLRFDVRATRRWATKHGEMRFFLELVNLTNHENVFGYDYFKDRDPNGAIVLKKDPETWFTILPSIGVAWSGSF